MFIVHNTHSAPYAVARLADVAGAPDNTVTCIVQADDTALIALMISRMTLVNHQPTT